MLFHLPVIRYLKYTDIMNGFVTNVKERALMWKIRTFMTVNVSLPWFCVTEQPYVAFKIQFGVDYLL